MNQVSVVKRYDDPVKRALRRQAFGDQSNMQVGGRGRAGKGVPHLRSTDMHAIFSTLAAFPCLYTSISGLLRGGLLSVLFLSFHSCFRGAARAVCVGPP